MRRFPFFHFIFPTPVHYIAHCIVLVKAYYEENAEQDDAHDVSSLFILLLFYFARKRVLNRKIPPYAESRAGRVYLF